MPKLIKQDDGSVVWDYDLAKQETPAEADEAPKKKTAEKGDK